MINNQNWELSELWVKIKCQDKPKELYLYLFQSIYLESSHACWESICSLIHSCMSASLMHAQASNWFMHEHTIISCVNVPSIHACVAKQFIPWHPINLNISSQLIYMSSSCVHPLIYPHVRAGTPMACGWPTENEQQLEGSGGRAVKEHRGGAGKNHCTRWDRKREAKVFSHVFV